MRLLVVLLLCACGSRQGDSSVAQEKPIAAIKLPEAPPLAAPGEQMSYRLYLRSVEVATYEISVGNVTEVAGKQTITIRTHAKSTGLATMLVKIDDIFTSWVDRGRGRPVLWTVDEPAENNVDRERIEARLAEREGDTVPVSFHLNDQAATPEPQRVTLPDVWDYNAYLIALRSWDAPTGSTVTLEVFRGRYLWNVKTTVGAREQVTTELGDFPAVRFDSHAYKILRDGKRAPDPERNFSVWISTDAARAPLKTIAETDYGMITVKLVDYQPGK